jgi:hypothetical protein
VSNSPTPLSIGCASSRPTWLFEQERCSRTFAAPWAPYLNVFLVTQQHWSQSKVGVMTTIGGFLGLTVQTPIGAAIVLSLVVLALGSMVISSCPRSGR